MHCSLDGNSALPSLEACDTLRHSYNMSFGIGLVFFHSGLGAKAEGYDDSYDTNCEMKRRYFQQSSLYRVNLATDRGRRDRLYGEQPALGP